MKSNQIHCKYHPNANLIEDFTAGDLICPVCGLVVGDRVIDHSSEWRSFANDGTGEDSSRVGAVENANNSEATTSIGIKNSHDVRHLDENGNQKYKNHVAMSPMERMLKQCRNHINEYGERLNADSNNRNHAMGLVKKLAESNEFNRKNKAAISCACLFLAFRDNSVPRTFKEMCAVSGVSKKDIGKTVKKVISAIGVEGTVRDVGVYLSRFCSRLNFKNKFVSTLASEIATLASNNKIISSKSPTTIIATSIYMASLLMNEERSRKIIGDILGVSQGTIATTYKIFYLNRHVLVPLKMASKFAKSVNELPSA